MSESVSEDSWNTCKAVIRGSRRISPDGMDEVRAIDLRIDDPAFRFQVGHSIGVLISGPHAFGSRPHHRYYSIANANGEANSDEVDIQIIVRRCSYIDDVSGEEYPGIASHYLCDAKPGDPITLTGPYKSVFQVPSDKSSNLLMIGTGTGIAPFRAFTQHIHNTHGGWDGKVRLFYGDRNGLDLLYLNDVDKDLGNYYQEETFKAFQSVSDKYLMNDQEALELTLEDHAKEAWEMLQDPKTYVFLAGTYKAEDAFEKVIGEQAGSEEQWATFKQKLIDEGRYNVDASAIADRLVDDHLSTME